MRIFIIKSCSNKPDTLGFIKIFIEALVGHEKNEQALIAKGASPYEAHYNVLLNKEDTSHVLQLNFYTFLLSQIFQREKARKIEELDKKISGIIQETSEKNKLMEQRSALTNLTFLNYKRLINLRFENPERAIKEIVNSEGFLYAIYVKSLETPHQTKAKEEILNLFIDEALQKVQGENFSSQSQKNDILYYQKFMEMLVFPEKYEGQQQNLIIDENFYPSATSLAVRQKMGAEEYSTLENQIETYSKAASSTILILNPLNGGLGTSVKRQTYLDSLSQSTQIGRNLITGHVKIATKGSDLYVQIGTKLVSVSALKLERILTAISSGAYASVIMQQLTSSESEREVQEMFNSQAVPSASSSSSHLPTYRQKLTSDSSRVSDSMIQSMFPVISVDPAGNPLALDPTRKAPGGHAQFGFKMIMEALAGKTGVAVFYNEDGLNNLPDPIMIGWMAHNRVPFAMVTTTKTGVDMKGGQLGIARNVAGQEYVDILEYGQVSPSQKKLFEQTGLDDSARNPQYFNTNMVLINYDVLVPIINAIEKNYPGKLAEIIMPTLIKNKKGSYIQLEGAIGSVILNLNKWLTTSEQGQKILAYFHSTYNIDTQRESLKAPLRIINLSKQQRTAFFTPIKVPFDGWLQFFSDSYVLDSSGVLKDARDPRLGLPDIAIDASVWDGYNDVHDMLLAFGNTSTKELKKLELKGQVRLTKNEEFVTQNYYQKYQYKVVLKGQVKFDVANGQVLSWEDLLSLTNKTGITLSSDGKQITLENVSIVKNTAGQVTQANPILVAFRGEAGLFNVNRLTPFIPLAFLNSISTQISENISTPELRLQKAFLAKGLTLRKLSDSAFAALRKQHGFPANSLDVADIITINDTSYVTEKFIKMLEIAENFFRNIGFASGIDRLYPQFAGHELLEKLGFSHKDALKMQAFINKFTSIFYLI